MATLPFLNTIASGIKSFFGQPQDRNTKEGAHLKLKDFISSVNSYGVAWNHLFMVQIKPIRAISGDGPEYGLVNLFCAGTQVPALNIMSASYREYHAHFEIPYGVSYEPVTMNFYGDKNLVIKKFFDRWYDGVYNKTSHKLNFMDDYAQDIEIIVLSKAQADGENGVVYKVVLKSAYPKSVGGIDLNHQNPSVVTFPVQFVYKDLVVDALTAEAAERTLIAALAAGQSAIAKPRKWPLNIWDQVTGAAGEIMGGVANSIQNVSGLIDKVTGGAAAVTNEIVTATRVEAQQAPAPVENRT